ncbi:hypothetical protein ACFQ88_23545 [Paenibacillus sp. NPDC056579]|uniref:hypothetical protein n=1 Tax=Paenibacillus sp. NPDC056579 TaxID=3345871 RepID=UPI00369CEC59
MSVISRIRFSTKQIVNVFIILSLACFLFQFGTTAEGAPVTTNYEAEDGDLNGSATVASKSIMSGGEYVRNIGNNSSNWAEITVNAASSGNAAMAIRYVSGEARSLFWSVYGGSGASASLNSGNWNTLATHNTTVSLNSGNNTIRFYNIRLRP